MMYALLVLTYGRLAAGVHFGADSADAAISRYAAFRKSYPRFDAEMVFQMSGVTMPLTFKLDGVTRMNARYHSAGVDYVVNITPSECIEVNYASKLYEEWTGSPTVRIPKSNITKVLISVPMWTLVPEFRRILPPGSKFAANGHKNVAGISCDLVHGEGVIQGVQFVLDAAIDSKGCIREMGLRNSGLGGALKQWGIKSWTPVTNWTADAFRVKAPNGFVPYSLPDTDGPIEAGGRFPVTGWLDARGHSLDLRSRLGRGLGLVAILGADSEPSQEAFASLKRLRRAMPVTVLTDGKKPMAGADGYDPTGRVIDGIGVRGTPLFFILDTTGRIVHIRMGYDASKASAFESDLIASLSAKPSSNILITRPVKSGAARIRG